MRTDLTFALAACLLGGCASVPPIPEPDEPMSAGYRVGLMEREKLREKANAGDVDAAVMLSKHYGTYAYDEDEYRKWLKKAAELGDPVSQYNLGFLYLYQDKQKAAAKPWFEKAAAQGYPKAKKVLRDTY